MPEEIPANSPLVAPIATYIEEIATSHALPRLAVGICILRYPDSGPHLRAAVQRGADGTLVDEDDERLFFRALFIVGARRDPLGFEPLLRFLRRSPQDVDLLLGNASSEHLPCIAAGMFNGDAEALFETILDLRLDDFARNSLLGAAAFLTWEGRIERDRMIAFLRYFDAERSVPDEDFSWYGWSQAIALLGLGELKPAVMAAWDRGAMPERLFAPEAFLSDLQAAERAPDDIQRFKDNDLGYIDDVIVVLEHWILDDQWGGDGGFSREPLPFDALPEPVINPFRHVGRNDPCPCGSGRKAKRCCLAA